MPLKIGKICGLNENLISSLLNFNNSWLIINRDGIAQFIDKKPIRLILDEQRILDAISYKDSLSKILD